MNKKLIYWIVGVILIILVFLILNIVGVLDFQELFVGGGDLPSKYSGSPGLGGVR